MPYRDAEVQTDWKGLMKKSSVRPDALLSPPPDLTTPPDDMLTEKLQFMWGGTVPTITHQAPDQGEDGSTTPKLSTLLERRRNRAGIDAHIDLPEASDPLNDEDPVSGKYLCPIHELYAKLDRN